MAAEAPLLTLVARRLVPAGLRHRFRESDLVQETFLVATQQYDRWADLSAGDRGRYFVGILRNVTAGRIRHELRQSRDPRREQSAVRYAESVADAAERELSDTAPGPASAATARDDWRRIAAVLASLPETQQAVVEAHFFDGLSHSETAARLGLTVGQVKHALRAAVTVVRDRVGETPGEAGQ